MRTALFLALLTLVAPRPALAQYGDGPNASGGTLLPEQAAFDVTYYSLDLAVDPAAQSIAGTLLMEALVVAPTDAVVLDLDTPLAVDAVEQVAYVVETGEEVALPLPFRREGGRIRIGLGRTAQPYEGLRLRVTYGGVPRVAPRPPWDGGLTWAQTEDGRPWVAVSVQGEGADAWWPVKDHPSDEPDSMRIALTVPAGLRAIANGRSEGRTDNGDGTATERWFVSTPINAYGVSFGIGPYEAVEADYESPAGYSMTVPFWVLPERADDARRQLPGFLDALAFLERTFGPYAWRADGYKILHTPYLGMEHQTLVAYGAGFEDNEWGFDWLHFHELAHEWWANLATAPDWRDFWIHESFATYAEALYAEDLARRRGDDAEAAYLGYLAGISGQIVNAAPLAPRERRTTKQMYTLPNGGFNGDLYYKGAWVLHTLRPLIDDDDAFFAALHAILYPDPSLEAVTDGRQARFVSTVDVVRAFSLAARRDLSDVFEVYLRQPDLPHLAVERGASEWTLRWTVPESAGDVVFDVPVEVEVNGDVQRIEMRGGVGRVAVPAGANVEIDPQSRVLSGPPVGV